MIIKSSFKDYYDGIGFEDQDKSYQTVTYTRLPELCLYDTQIRDEHKVGYCGCIFVCGKAYPFLYEKEDVTEEVKSDKIPKILYKIVGERKYFKKIWFSEEEYELGKKQKKSEKPKRRKDFISFEIEEKKARQKIKNFFEYYKGNDFTKMHVQVDSPLILTFFTYFHIWAKNNKEELEIIKNPCLRELDFARIMPPTTIFQEIEMFLGNVLVKDVMPMSYQSDIEKVVSHGFDKKISFRKRKNF